MDIETVRNDFEQRLGILDSKKDQYKDIDLTFRRNPITNDVLIKKDISAVTQALKNIILTNFFERPFSPAFGSNIWTELFEPMDEFAVINIKDRMKTAIKNNEPRVSVLDITFEFDDKYNSIAFSIYYRLPASEETFTTQFSVERVR